MLSALRRARCELGLAFGKAIAWSLRNVQPRVIQDGRGERPYLSRYYLRGAPTMADGSLPYDRYGNPKPEARFPPVRWGLYVHRFHRSDIDRELHSHPWSWALSFVIAGGYREERRVGDHVISRIVPPISFNVLRGDDFHRIDLLGPEAWTLFLVGPKVTGWGFWDRRTNDFTPWRQFLASKQGNAS